MLNTLFEKHPQWAQIQEIDQTLRGAGFQAVLAGGCVRDALLGKVAKDIDIATDATPEQIATLFTRVIMVGESFGVCRVLTSEIEGQLPVEVATFREESDYQDGRHPQKVVYSTLDKDAQRRDFTINAMYFDLHKQQLIDTVNGAVDLRQRVLRTVGDPQQRFQEDSLRLLRAARFSAQMDLTIEQETLKVLRARAFEIHRVSKERIQDEINKAFQITQPRLFFSCLSTVGLQKEIFKDWSWEEKSLSLFFANSVSVDEGWAGLSLLQTSFKIKNLNERLKELKLSNDKIYFVQTGLLLKDFLSQGREDDLRGFVNLMKRRDIQKSVACTAKALQALSQKDPRPLWQGYLTRYCPQGALPTALVTGEDLLQAGQKPGPNIGRDLEETYLWQLQNPNLDKSGVLSLLLQKRKAK